MNKVKHLKFEGARIIVDKEDWFFSEKRTWAEARDTFPLDQDITPKRFDLIAEAKAHLAEVRHREKTGERSRYIDTDTESLVEGLLRAEKFIKDNHGLAKVAVKETESWKTESKEDGPARPASPSAKSARQGGQMVD